MDNRNWSWIRTARLDTKEFKRQLIEAGEATGQLKRDSEGNLRTADKTLVTWENFQTTLSDKWLDSKTMNLALSKFGKYAEEIYEIADAQKITVDEAIKYYDAMHGAASDTEALGKKAFLAAQEARTFSDAILAVKDAVSSKWTESFNLIFGNYEEAKKMWTDLSVYLWDIFAAGGETRNDILRYWKDNFGRDRILGFVDEETDAAYGFYNAARQLKKGLDIVKKAFWTTLGFDPDSDTFVADIGQKLVEWSNKIGDFLDGLDLTEEKAEKLYSKFSAIFGLFKNIFDGVKNVFGVVKEIFGIFSDVFKEKFGDTAFKGIIDIGNTFGELLQNIELTDDRAQQLKTIFDTVLTIAKDIFDFIVKIGTNAETYLGPVVDAFGFMLDIITKIASKVKEIHDNSDLEGSFGWLTSIIDYIKGFFGSISFDTVSEYVSTAFDFISGIVKGIMDLASSFGPQVINLGLIGSFAMLLLRVAEAIDSINDSGIKGWLNGDVGSVWNETLLGRLVFTLKSINFAAIAIGVITFAGALVLLGLAIKTIGEMNGWDVALGLTVIAGAIILLVVALKKMVASGSWKDLLIGAAVLFAISIAAIAAAVAILAIAGAFKIFNMVLTSSDNIIETVIAIGALFVALAYGIYTLGKNWKTLLLGAAVLFAISIAAIAAAVAILAIAGAFKIFNMVLTSSDNIIETVIAIGALFVALAYGIYTLGQYWGILLKGVVVLIAISAALVIASGALLVFGLVLGVLSAIPMEKIIGSAFGLAAAMFVLGIVIGAMGSFWPVLLIGAGVMIVLAIAIVALAGSMLLLSAAWNSFSGPGEGYAFDANENGELIVKKTNEVAADAKDAAENLDDSANDLDSAYEHLASAGSGAGAHREIKRNSVNTRAITDGLWNAGGNFIRGGNSVAQYEAALSGSEGGMWSTVPVDAAKGVGEETGAAFNLGFISSLMNGEGAESVDISTVMAQYGFDPSSIPEQLTGMISGDGTMFEGAGTDIMQYIASGMTLGQPAVDTSVEAVAASANQTLEEAATDAVTSGENFSKGFANGIDNGSYLAKAAAERLGLKALSTLSLTIQEGSPSKLTYLSGAYFEEGFSNAITDYAYRSADAAKALGQETYQALGEGLGRMDGIANGTIRTAPTIRPVFDARDIQNGSRNIDTMFASRQAMYANIADQERRNGTDIMVLKDIMNRMLDAVEDGQKLYLDGHTIVGYVNRGLGKR